MHSAIGRGLLILLGVEESDELSELEWLVKKCANLRIFDDENGGDEPLPARYRWLKQWW